MDNLIPESGCEKCGTEIMLPATTPLDPYRDPPPSNKCRACGHLTDFPPRFYWAGDIKAFVLGNWRDIPMKEFRLDPKGFVKSKLNPWLKGKNRGHVVVEPGKHAPTLKWVKNSE